MKAKLLATTVVVAAAALSTSPAQAQRGSGAAFGAGLLGGVVGGVIGGTLAQRPPAPVYVAPAPVYVPPPVVYERRVYVAPAPVYVAPAQHVIYHPWPGPGFACYDPEPNAVNRAICASEDLSAASLAVQQALYAAIQETPYNAGALRAEYAGFQQNEHASCSQYSFQQVGDCVAGMLSHEHDVLTGRLTGVFADEAARPVAVHVQVQQRLHAMGLLPGVADGLYGDGTRRAISTWQSGQGLSATGVLTDDQVAMLIPAYGTGTPYVSPRALPPPAFPVQQATAAPQPAPAPAPAPVQQAAVSQPQPQPQPQPPAPVAASNDPMGGVHENMPYALARSRLFAAGWQTQFFSTAALSEPDRDARQWFIDHHITEVEDCSSSGCKMQFHNADGRLLYVYTQVGSHSSDAYRGAGPSVVAYCLDVDDITCPAPASPTVPVSQQATK